MDVQMPEAFGDDVAMVLRAAREIDAPIYLLSTLDEAELKRRATEAEIEGYISKQIGVEAIIARVRQILGVA
jgi:DNA-binding NarL/FixJ family response regulator